MVAGARHAGQTHDLPGRHPQAEVVQPPAGAHVADLELPGALADLERVGDLLGQLGVGLLGRLLLRLFGRLAEHRGDDGGDGEALARLGGHRDLAVAQDGDLVAQRHDVLEDVGDEDDADLAVAQDAQDLEQRPGAGGAQRRGRLVEDQDPRVGQQRLADLDQLALGEAELGDRGAEVDVEAELVDDRARSGGHLGAVDERAAAGLAQREQVGEHVEVGEDVELLRHDRDAVADRLGRGAEVDFLVVQADRAGVGGERAGDDLHQRRLAGAVLTQESVHGAGADREVRAGQRDDAAVRLANASRFEHALTPWAG